MKDLEGLPKLYIRGQIAPKQSLFSLFGEPEETVGTTEVRKFLDDNKDADELVVEFSSDGGYKTEGVEMYQLLKNSGKTIYGIIYKANSIATVVVLGCTHRLIAETAQFYVHFARIDPVNLGMDPLTAEDLQHLAEETQRSDKQILDIYCDELGQEKRTELLAAMGEERDLGAKGAVKLGFATGYYKKKKKEKTEAYRNVFITDSIAEIIMNNMEKSEQQKKIEGLEATLSNLKKNFVKFFTGNKVKNQITLNTDKGAIYVEPLNPDDPSLVGATVKKVDADGLPTEEKADDGTYKIDDGRTITVAAGAVTEETAAVDAKKLEADLAAEKEKSKGLETQLAELKTQMEKEKTEAQGKITAFEKDLVELRKTVLGDKMEKKDSDKDEKEPDYAKMSRAEIAAYNAKIRRQELAQK